MTEEDREQITLMEWCEVFINKYPQLKLFYHCPNGGSRNVAEAAKLKRMGTKRGVPDLFLPVARHGYHGLYIEMKATGGRLEKEQKKWIAALREQGYAAVVRYGWEAARQTLEEYLEEQNDK